MNPYFLSGPTQKDIHEFTPKLTSEFNDVPVQMLALQYHREQLALHRRMWLAQLGAGLIELGRRIQHLAHVPFAARHTSWKAVALQSIKVRHHRQTF